MDMNINFINRSNKHQMMSVPVNTCSFRSIHWTEKSTVYLALGKTDVRRIRDIFHDECMCIVAMGSFKLY